MLRTSGKISMIFFLANDCLQLQLNNAAKLDQTLIDDFQWMNAGTVLNT